MRSYNIICKNCGYEIQVEEVLLKQAEETVRQEYVKKSDKQIEAHKKDKELFNKEKKEFEEAKAKEEKIIQNRLDELLDKEKQKLKAKVDKEHEDEMKKLKKENLAFADEIKELKKREDSLKKLENEIRDKQEYAEIEIQKRILDEKDELEAEIKKKAQNRIEVLIKEYDKKLAGQKKIIEELRQETEEKLKQPDIDIGRIEELLKKAYPNDKISYQETKGKAEDLRIDVFDDDKNECGRIMIHIEEDEITDELLGKAADNDVDLFVIAAKELPDDMREKGHESGVLLTAFNDIPGVVFVMRQFLIKENQSKTEKKSIDDKKDAMGNYLKSDEFKDRIQGLITGFTSLREQIEKERRAMLNLWEQREKQIEMAIENTVGVYGAIKGIGGKEIKEIEDLEL